MDRLIETKKYETLYGSLPSIIWCYAVVYGHPKILLRSSGEKIAVYYPSGFRYQFEKPKEGIRLRSIEEIRQGIAEVRAALKKAPSAAVARTLLAALGTLYWVIGKEEQPKEK